LPEIHPLHLDHFVGVAVKVEGEEGLDPWVDHRPRFGLGFRLWFRFRLRFWFWLRFWLGTLHEGQAKRGMVFDIWLLRGAHAQSLHDIRAARGSGHLHSIGAQRGEHREVAAPGLAGLLLNGYAGTATRPRYLDLLAHEAPALTVYDVKEDMMFASRLLNVIPQDLSQLVGITTEIERQKGLDARVNFWPWLWLRLWLRLRFWLGFGLGFGLRFGLRFRLGFWFRFRLGFRLRFRLGAVCQPLPYPIQVAGPCTSYETESFQQVPLPLGPDGPQAGPGLTGFFAGRYLKLNTAGAVGGPEHRPIVPFFLLRVG
jgi:hypothetical protein